MQELGPPSPLHPPVLRDDIPNYPPLLQLLRVTGTTILGPGAGSFPYGVGDAPALLYEAFVAQLRTDNLRPRDRETCLANDVNRLGLVPNRYYFGRLSGSYNDLPVYTVAFAADQAGSSAIPGIGGGGTDGGSSQLEAVTDVQCVNGQLQVTKSTLSGSNNPWTETGVKTAAYTVVSGENALVSSAAAAANFDVTLPGGTPPIGARWKVTMTADHPTQLVGINRNGNLVDGSTNVDKWKLCLDGDTLEGRWVGDETGWSVSDGIKAHSAKMRRDAAQTGIANGTLTTIQLANIEYDVGGLASTVSNEFTIRRAGNYEVSAGLGLFAAAGDLNAYIVLDGAGVGVGRVAFTGGAAVAPVMGTIACVAGNVIKLQIIQTSGGPLDTVTGTDLRPRMILRESRR